MRLIILTDLLTALSYKLRYYSTLPNDKLWMFVSWKYLIYVLLLIMKFYVRQYKTHEIPVTRPGI